MILCQRSERITLKRQCDLLVVPSVTTTFANMRCLLRRCSRAEGSAASGTVLQLHSFFIYQIWIVATLKWSSVRLFWSRVRIEVEFLKMFLEITGIADHRISHYCFSTKIASKYQLPYDTLTPSSIYLLSDFSLSGFHPVLLVAAVQAMAQVVLAVVQCSMKTMMMTFMDKCTLPHSGRYWDHTCTNSHQIPHFQDFVLLSCVPFLYDFPWRKHVAAWFALALMWVGVRGCWNLKVSDSCRLGWGGVGGHY